MNNVKLFYMERLPLTTILMSRTCLNYVCVFFLEGISMLQEMCVVFYSSSNDLIIWLDK